MISKEKIVEIIREETWVEVDSSRVYGIEEAAEKVLQAIEAAEQSVQSDGDYCTCKPYLVEVIRDGVWLCSYCYRPRR